jgi:hypothetical protein
MAQATNTQESSVFTSALRRARRLVGDDRLLAHRLHVPVADLQRWLAGEQSPPREVFLAAVDIVMDTPEMFLKSRRRNAARFVR